MTIINIVIICVNTIEGLVEEEYFTHVMPINYVLILCDTEKLLCKIFIFLPILIHA